MQISSVQFAVLVLFSPLLYLNCKLAVKVKCVGCVKVVMVVVVVVVMESAKL